MTKQPVLLIPVFRGGVFFQEAMISVVACIPYFQEIIISLNGEETSEDMNVALTLKGQIPLQILQTHRNLNCIQHFQFIAKSLEHRLVPDQEIFIFCHDDKLYLNGIEESFKDGTWESILETITLGQYLTFQDGQDDCEAIIQHAFNGSLTQCTSVTRSQWLENLEHVHRTFTNASGTRLPFSVLRDAINFMCRTKDTRGMRFEYLLAAHSGNKLIRESTNPHVLIRKHPVSEGAIASRMDYLTGELRYSLWLIIHCKSINEFVRQVRSPFGVGHVLQISAKLLRDRGFFSRQIGRVFYLCYGLLRITRLVRHF